MDEVGSPVRVIVQSGRPINRSAYALDAIEQARRTRAQLDKPPARLPSTAPDTPTHCSGCRKPTPRNQLHAWQSSPRADGPAALRLLLCDSCNAAALSAEATINRPRPGTLSESLVTGSGGTRPAGMPSRPHPPQQPLPQSGNSTAKLPRVSRNRQRIGRADAGIPDA